MSLLIVSSDVHDALLKFVENPTRSNKLAAARSCKFSSCINCSLLRQSPRGGRCVVEMTEADYHSYPAGFKLLTTAEAYRICVMMLAKVDLASEQL